MAYDLAFERRNCADHILLLAGGHFEFVQSVSQRLDRDVPVFLGDAETGVGRHHVASGVFAGAAGGHAEKIHNVLPDAGLGIGAQADEEAAFFGVGRQAVEEVVGDCRQSVIAAQALVEGILG